MPVENVLTAKQPAKWIVDHDSTIFDQRLTNLHSIVATDAIRKRLLTSAVLLRPGDLLRVGVPAEKPGTPTKLTVRNAAMALVSKVAEVAAVPAIESAAASAAHRYLSFPTGSIPVDLDDEFHLLLLLNGVPETAGPVWRSSSRLLWRVWEEEFLDVEVANVGRSPEVLAARAEARAVLTNEDGSDSPRLIAYTTWQRAHEAKVDEIASSAPADEEGRNALIEASETIMTRWLIAGFKTEIEDAIAVLASLGRTPPEQQFAEARAHRESLLDRRTDTQSHMEYPAMQLVPSLSKLVWEPFECGPKAIRRLSAGVEGRFPTIGESSIYDQLFDEAESGDAEVERIHGELAFVAIDRPWLQSNLLTSRAWRLPEGAVPFSDGEAPPSGRLPAYAVGAILARDVQLEVKKDTPVSRPRPPKTGRPANRITDKVVTLPINGRFDRIADRVSDRLAGTLIQGPVGISPRAAAAPADDIRLVGFLFETVPKAPDTDESLFGGT